MLLVFFEVKYELIFFFSAVEASLFQDLPTADLLCKKSYRKFLFRQF